MAATVAHELSQTLLDKPWSNAYPLSLLSDAADAVWPTSSVRRENELVALDIELPVEEWGEWSHGRAEEPRGTEVTATVKRQLEEDAPSCETAKCTKLDNNGSRSFDPLPVFLKRRAHAGGKKHRRRTTTRSLDPSPPPAVRPPAPQRAPPAATGPPSTSELSANDDFVFNFDFDFTANPPDKGGRKGKTRPTPAQLPPANETPVLTEQMLVHGVRFENYMPYLFDTPVEPKWSQITKRQPDRLAIQAAFSPGRSPGWKYLTENRRIKFLAMLDGMKWSFGDETLTVDAVSHLVRYAPLPLHILAREYASVIRLSEATQHAERELIRRLNSLRRVTPHQAAAIVLLRWLQPPHTRNRHYLFFTHPDGSLRFEDRGEPPWAWWFKRVETGDLCTAEVLDDWEKEVLAEEDWSGFE
ncbi:proteophosphoglycan ppg4 [Rhodotorula toruloides]|uniref:Proteophosphoglycan ppg4 n=1 Tax=Rhodotorula toruloides TaxID=5286 RepID=A0A511KL01_RHOTO|nr:proteophosphoglycan ppg4 [Rhodotorula toruloides]